VTCEPNIDVSEELVPRALRNGVYDTVPHADIPTLVDRISHAD